MRQLPFGRLSMLSCLAQTLVLASGACIVVAACATGPGEGLGEGRASLGPTGFDKRDAQSGVAPPVVPLEVSGRVEGVGGGGALDSFGFSTRVELSGGRTLRLSGGDTLGTNLEPVVPGLGQALPLDMGKGPVYDSVERFSIEVTPVAFNEDSVELEFQLFRIDEKTGKRQVLSRPRIIAPYGSLSEIQEMNPSPKADFARLNLSVLPVRPEAAGESSKP